MKKGLLKFIFLQREIWLGHINDVENFEVNALIFFNLKFTESGRAVDLQA